MTQLADHGSLTHHDEWVFPRWFDDPEVVSAREKSHLAHRAWMQATAPDGWTFGHATPLQRLLYERLRSADVAYEVAKQSAMDRLAGMSGEELPHRVGGVQGR